MLRVQKLKLQIWKFVLVLVCYKYPNASSKYLLFYMYQDSNLFRYVLRIKKLKIF